MKTIYDTFGTGAKITEKKADQYCRQFNKVMEIKGLRYRAEVNPRNGYCAIDGYHVSIHGVRLFSGCNNICSGTPRECCEALYQYSADIHCWDSNALEFDTDRMNSLDAPRIKALTNASIEDINRLISECRMQDNDAIAWCSIHGNDLYKFSYKNRKIELIK